MDYIFAEQFLEQPEEVLKTFMSWWKPNIGDLYCDENAHGLDNISCVLTEDTRNEIIWDKRYSYFIPLFTEAQLRSFIEEELDGKIDCTYWEEGYEINLFKKEIGDELIKCFFTNQTDLLQAYWEVACKIAKEHNTKNK